MVASVVVVVALVSMAVAGPLQNKQVAADAKWVMHADIDGMRASKVGAFCLDEIKKADNAGKVAKLTEKIGFNPLKDLKSITAYGSKHGRENAVVLVNLDADQQKIIAMLKENKDYKQTKLGDHVVHQWTDKEEVKKFGMFYRKDLVIVAPDMDLLTGAVAVLDGKKDNLSKAKFLDIKPSKGAFFLLVAEDIVVPEGKKRRGPMQNVDACNIEIGEVDGKVFLNVTLEAKTEEKAERMLKMIAGLIAFAEMRKEAEEEMDPVHVEVISLLGEIKASGKGKTIKIEALFDVKDITSLIKLGIEKKLDEGE
ncbi:MAG: hypothetical protein QGD94_11365, partial [Planctomycetia bacterium]|nr:hypothetical protein [Planctomycetia bacterium]